jgi:hypothetical protein
MPAFSAPREPVLFDDAPTGGWGFRQVASYERFRTAYTPTVDFHADKRQCPRRGLRCPLTMTQLLPDPTIGDTHPIEGECIDISDGGLYAIVPLGYGVAIGQRYLFRLRVRERGPCPDPNPVVTQEGTIMRTELLLDAGGDRVGIGVRLCGHRTGDLILPRA